jgi:hypothetical protein
VQVEVAVLHEERRITLAAACLVVGDDAQRRVEPRQQVVPHGLVGAEAMDQQQRAGGVGWAGR